MASAWDKIEAEFKKLQPQIKKLDAKQADKLLKLTKLSLQNAWDEEEKFIEALEAAQMSGSKGKKPGDFMGDPGFKKTHQALTKSAATHAAAVKALQAQCDTAKALNKVLVRLLGDIKKEKPKGNKARETFQKDVMQIEASSKAIAVLTGKLTMPELFYGPRIAMVIDKIINKSKKAAGPSGDAEKLIEAKELTKNLKRAMGLMKDVDKLCKGALKKAKSDPDAAEPFLQKAGDLLDEVEAIDKAYQKVLKKNAKLIKAAKEKSGIERAIKGISKAHDVAAKTLAAVEKALKKLAA